MKRLTLLVLCTACAWSAPADFNGRWILEVPGEARGRAWWLKVEGAGTTAMRGEFIGAPGGQLDPIPALTIDKGGALIWEFERVYDRQLNTTQEGMYRARLTDGKLAGELTAGGRVLQTFTGSRAPALPDRDDGSWVKQKPVELFNGRDLSGWRVAAPKRSLNEWQAIAGSLRNGNGKAPDIASDRRFWNFELHMEFRVAQHSNSGIGLRGRYEVQIYGDHGEPPSLHGNGALYSRIAPAVNATLPPDQWQTIDIRLVGRTVTVVLNGKKLIDKREIEGLTAMATDPYEDQPGPLMLQGDHGPVEFRKVTVTPLEK
ncbi:MAG: DUF1080 domain-containing protein [Acidobacteria bacterium]|nr:DUF1080 domain-containing protein [Acidobacteriota bacterium]